MEDIVNDVVKEIDRYTSRITDNIEKQSEAIDDLITKEQALLDVKTKEYDMTNKLNSAQREINKELIASKISYEYLDDATRKLIFNEEDYNKLSEKIAQIRDDSDALAYQFYEKIENLEEDELYLAEAITAEYERQLAMKERELEIAKAEVELQKKRDQLNNILAEKNIRVFKDGQWQWTYDTDAARQAAMELADVEGQIAEMQLQREQQIDLDERQASIDNLNSEKSAYEQQIKMIQEAGEKLKTAIEDIQNPIQGIGLSAQQLIDTGINPLTTGLQDLLETINKVTNKNYSTGSSGGGLSGGGSGGNAWTKAVQDAYDAGDYDTVNKLMNEPLPSSGGRNNSSSNNQNDSPTVKGLLADANAAYARGDNDTGDKLINQAVDLDKKKAKHAYAIGTNSARRVIAEVDENGQETYITSHGKFHSFAGGEKVFNAERTANLWKISSVPFEQILQGLTVPRVENKTATTDNRVNISGNQFHFHEVQNGQQAAKEFINLVKQKSYTN